MVRLRIWLAIFSLLAAPHVTQAATAHVQHAANGSTTGATTLVVTISAATAGNSLICAYGIRDSTLTSVTDSASNTWVADSSGSYSAGTRVFGTQYVKNISGAPTTITLTTAGANTSTAMICHEVSGQDTTTTIDVAGAVTSGTFSTATDAVTSGNITTATNGAYIFGYTIDMEQWTPLLNTGTGYTTRVNNNAAGNQTKSSESQIQTSAGAIAATFTTNGTNTVVVGVSAIKAAGGAAAETFGFRRRLQVQP